MRAIGDQRRPALRAAGYALLPILLSALVYYPITGNYFFLDDFQHLYAIADGRALAFLVTPHQGHMLPARNALFILCWELFGTDPRGYLWLALLTHLLNVALLFRVVRAFTGSRRLACFGAALWGVSPLNEGALGWYSVYGQVLLTTIVLWVLLRMAQVASGLRRQTRGAAIGWYLLLLLGTTLFGTGIGLALAAVIAVALLLPAEPFVRRLFASLLVVVPGLYGLVHWLYGLATGQPGASAARALPVADTVSTMARMTAHLAAYGAARPLAAYFAPAWPYPGWGLATIAAAFWIAVGCALLAAPRPRRRALLACLVLALGGFGIVALGRAPVYASGEYALFFPTLTALAIAPRYYYAPTALLVLAACLVLRELGARLRRASRWADAGLGLWLAASAAAYLRHPLAIDHFDNQRAQVEQMQTVVRRAVASAAPGRTIYVKNRAVEPLVYLAKPWEFPGWAGLFVIFSPDDRVDGRTVRFLLYEPEVVAALRRRAGTRSAALVVTPDEFHRAVGTRVGTR